VVRRTLAATGTLSWKKIAEQIEASAGSVVAGARVNKRSADKGPSRISLWVFRDIPLTNLSECPPFD
ncbi:MAG: hypothetical protein ACPGT1_10535, partial [Ilumatobacteraceae bacterium]